MCRGPGQVAGIGRFTDVPQYAGCRNAVGHEGDDAHADRAHWAHDPSLDSDKSFTRQLARIFDIAGLDTLIGDTNIQEILAKF
ncbi:MAG: hypothetical protein GY792_20640 [Gammaproteobacteria bacterium]|nr:hypothetical protein [Gammaproteobacteria bacterium]